MELCLAQAIMKAVDEEIDDAYMAFREQVQAEYAETTAYTYLLAVDKFRLFLKTGELRRHCDR